MPTRIISGWKDIPITAIGNVPVEQGPGSLPWLVEVDGISVINFNVSGSILAIAPSTKTTIVSQVFIASTFENVSIVSVSGTNYAKYFFMINGSDIDVRRSGPDLNLSYDFTGSPFSLSPGDLIEVKAEHFNVGTVDFDATIYGYD